MGHYRSEMISDAEYERERQYAAEHRARILKGVEAQLEEEGVASVLTSLIEALVDSRVYVASKWEHYRKKEPDSAG